MRLLGRIRERRRDRVFVLGLDGTPHSYLREEVAAGRLPNLAALFEEELCPDDEGGGSPASSRESGPRPWLRPGAPAREAAVVAAEAEPAEAPRSTSSWSATRRWKTSRS